MTGYIADSSWLPALPLTGSPNKPVLSADYYDISK
jgi:hypothetical protein